MTLEARALAALPVLLVAILTLWVGTFHGAASGPGAVLCQVLILGACLFGDLHGFDPLALGRSGRWLLPALLAAILISWGSSPVGRAGTTAMALLPACLLIPMATARCWPRGSTRDLGSAGVTLVTLTVALLALVKWQLLSLPRASLPLGHHNLLAGWLVLVLPLAVASGHRPGPMRWLSGATGVVGLAALSASGSLLGGVALTVQLVLAAIWWPRVRKWALGLALIAALASLPRISTIAAWGDASAAARATYLTAGWQGLLSRPATGWGPGSVPWTLPLFLEPREGVQPHGEVIGDLHSLPVQLAYELGIPGLLLTATISGLFLWRRWRELQSPSPDPMAGAALLGLIGGGVFAFGAAPLAVPALPVTAAVIAGAALVPAPAPSATRWRLAPLVIYMIGAAIVLVPLDRAHLLYDRARSEAVKTSSHAMIARAAELDPEFALYRAREAWLAAEIFDIDRETAERALQAAEMAPGLAPLWLVAGNLGTATQAPWAPAALLTAHELDPLSPVTAFHRMTVTQDLQVAAKLGSDAVSSEPRLRDAAWWLEHPDLARAVGRLSGEQIPSATGSITAEPALLALGLDRVPALSFSLYAFRRTPWPARIGAIDLMVD